MQVYSAIGDIGIDGRGPKYRVFECDDSEDMKKLLQWRSISVKTYDNANVYPVLHGLETDEREIDGEYLIPLGEYMCFRQTKSESSIVLTYSEEQGHMPARPTSVYMMRATTEALLPHMAATRSNWNMPTRPQFIAPIIMSINDNVSIKTLLLLYFLPLAFA